MSGGRIGQLRGLDGAPIRGKVEADAESMARLPDGSWPEQAQVLRDNAALELASIGLTLPVRAIYRTTSLAG